MSIQISIASQSNQLRAQLCVSSAGCSAQISRNRHNRRGAQHFNR
jgi:hypothetical protein